MADTNDLDCAALVMETFLLGMRTIITQMRAGKPAHLTVPQFRLLGFLNRHDGVSLSDMAKHSGVTLPSMSRLVDGLVKERLVMRETAPDDRRRITLSITEEGRTLFRSVEDSARSRIAEILSTLSLEERSQILRAMGVLRSVLLQNVSGTEKCK